MREIDTGPMFCSADNKGRPDQFTDDAGIVWENIHYDFEQEYESYLTGGGEKPPIELFEDLPRHMLRRIFLKMASMVIENLQKQIIHGKVQRQED